MTDIFSTEQRSHIMRQIKGKGTKPEITVRKYLFSRGFRYRVNVRRLPGSPDIVLRKYHTVIFIHGCFWHGHEGCRPASRPKTNSEFWEHKITRNKSRDAETREKLKAMGWNTIVVWECQLSKTYIREQTLNSIVQVLDETFLKLNQPKRAVVAYIPFETSPSLAAESRPLQPTGIPPKAKTQKSKT